MSPGQIQQVTEAKEEMRRRALGKALAITGGAVLAGIAMPFMFLGALGAVGFGAGGVVAGKFRVHRVRR